MRAPAVLAAALAALSPGPARASAPGTFGAGPRSEALSQADLASSDPAAGPQLNPALTAAPGVHARIGWSYTSIGALVSGQPTGLRELHGLDVGAAGGFRLARWLDVGGGATIHLPDRGIAALTFRPASEPQLVRFGPDLERATFDLALGVRLGPVWIGGGATIAVGVAGGGATFRLGSEAGAAYAVGQVDLTLPYRAAPVLGAKVDLGPVSLALTGRGGLGIDLTLPSSVRIDLGGFPLDGSTDVFVLGVAGYDPTRVTLGVTVTPVPRLVLAAAFEYAAWGAAPSPAADVDLRVALGTIPGDRVVDFGPPRFRDTLAPRVGVEGVVHGPAGDPYALGRLALRAGWHASPSPVPPQRGFASYADADRHAFTFGSAVGLGAPLGVHLAASAAGQVHVLVDRTFVKDDPALPNARYDVSGTVGRASLALEGAFR